MKPGCVEYLFLAVAAPVLLVAGMVAFDQWTLYHHDYAHAGIKFAPAAHAGCGVEILTNDGRDAGLDTFYCE